MTALTSADVNMVVVAAQIMKDRPWAWSFSQGLAGPEIHVHVELFRSVCEVEGLQPQFSDRPGSEKYPWRAEVLVGGVRFFCVASEPDAVALGLMKEAA